MPRGVSNKVNKNLGEGETGEDPIVPPTGDETPLETPKPTSKSTLTSINVYDESNVFVRTYSQAVHGDDFSDLADQFIAKFAGIFHIE